MNWKVLFASLIQTIFFCLVIAAVITLYHISYMTSNYSIMWLVGAGIFFAIIWELYHLHTQGHKPLRFT